MPDRTIEVSEALERAASAGDGALTALSIDRPSVSSREREARIQNVLKRFLEAMPEDATVLEMREAIELMESGN